MENVIESTGVIDLDNGFVKHIGIIRGLASMWGDKEEDIVDIKLKISEDQSEPDYYSSGYWGWWPADGKMMNLICPNYAAFYACFPYGVDKAVESGQGTAYRLELVEIDGIKMK